MHRSINPEERSIRPEEQQFVKRIVEITGGFKELPAEGFKLDKRIEKLNKRIEKLKNNHREFDPLKKYFGKEVLQRLTSDEYAVLVELLNQSPLQHRIVNANDVVWIAMLAKRENKDRRPSLHKQGALSAMKHGFVIKSQDPLLPVGTEILRKKNVPTPKEDINGLQSFDEEGKNLYENEHQALLRLQENPLLKEQLGLGLVYAESYESSRSVELSTRNLYFKKHAGLNLRQALEIRENKPAQDPLFVLWRLITVFSDVAEQLKNVLDLGFAHADIKEENVIMLDGATKENLSVAARDPSYNHHGHGILIDFGFFSKLGTKVSRGTPFYLAPESYHVTTEYHSGDKKVTKKMEKNANSSRNFTKATQVYALGLTLARTLSPFYIIPNWLKKSTLNPEKRGWFSSGFDNALPKSYLATSSLTQIFPNFAALLLLLQKMTTPAPEERETITEVCKTLQQFKKELANLYEEKEKSPKDASQSKKNVVSLLSTKQFQALIKQVTDERIRRRRPFFALLRKWFRFPVRFIKRKLSLAFIEQLKILESESSQHPVTSTRMDDILKRFKEVQQEIEERRGRQIQHIPHFIEKASSYIMSGLQSSSSIFTQDKQTFPEESRISYMCTKEEEREESMRLVYH